MHTRGLVFFVGGVLAALAFAPFLTGLVDVPAWQNIPQLDPLRPILNPVLGLLAVVLVISAVTAWPLLTGWWRKAFPRRGRRRHH